MSFFYLIFLGLYISPFKIQHKIRNKNSRRTCESVGIAENVGRFEKSQQILPFIDDKSQFSTVWRECIKFFKNCLGRRIGRARYFGNG